MSANICLSNLSELEKIYNKEWEKMTKSKLKSSDKYPRQPKSVTAAKQLSNNN